MQELRFLPKLLLQHDSSPEEVLEDVHGAFVRAAQQRLVQASVSPSGEGLAVALGQRLVLLRLFQRGRSSTVPGSGAAAGHPAVEFVSAVDAPETVTAVAWLAASGTSTGAHECILLGTSAGFLQLHCAASGARLLRQQLHHSAAVAAAVRWGGCGLDPDDRSDDITLTFTDAVARLPAWEVWAAVRWHAGRGTGGGGWWGGGSPRKGAAPHHLTFSKFSLPRGTGPRSHAVCLGPPPLSLHAALVGRQEQAGRLRILTAGSAPPLASYEGEESASPGLLSLVSELASSTAASLLGRARAYMPLPSAAGRSLLRRQGSGAAGGEGGGSHGEQRQQQQQGGGKREKIPAEPASLAASVWDEKRSVARMALSPNGRWAACCDSLGRVSLVDTAATLVLRMIKGYRDAQVAWLVCSRGSGSGGGVAGLAGTSGAGLAALGNGGSSLGSSLGLLGGSTSSLASMDGSLAGGWRGSAADLASLSSQQEEELVGGLGADGGPGTGEEPGQKQQQQQQQEPFSSPRRQQRRQQLSASPSPQKQRQQGQQQSDAGLGRSGWRPTGGHLLVIYAPRRAVVELWEPQSLARLGSLRCSTQLGLLLQQPAWRSVGGSGATAGGGFAPNRCWLFDAVTLNLVDLTESLIDLL